MLALLGAVGEELIALRRHMVREEVITGQGYHIYRGKYGSKDILLVQTGMGKERAEMATNFILEHYPVTTLLPLGFAGALTEELKAGDVILCSTLYCGNEPTGGEPPPENPYYSDANLVSLASQTLEGTAVGFYKGSSVTVAQPVSRPEAKRALGRASHADIVDMESYWIARIASARQVPFMAIRAVSDTVQDSLPPCDRIMDSDGTWRLQKAVLYFVSHPHHLMKLFTLYRGVRQARKNLTASVERLVTKL